jgi:ankyrin repeat protein
MMNKKLTCIDVTSVFNQSKADIVMAVTTAVVQWRGLFRITNVHCIISLKNARVEWGSTALHAASDRGHIKLVNLLIQR